MTLKVYFLFDVLSFHIMEKANLKLTIYMGSVTSASGLYTP